MSHTLHLAGKRPRQRERPARQTADRTLRPDTFSGSFGVFLAPLLLDTGFLTCEVAQVEDAGTAHCTVLVDVYLLNERGRDREYALHAHAIGNLTNSKGLGGSASATLQHNALEVLDTFFVTFFDFIVNRDGVASLEFGELFAFYQILYVLQ